MNPQGSDMASAALRPLRVSIGILAYNEAERLPAMLETLCRQNLLQEPAPDVAPVEILIVPNGSTDQTPAVAERGLARLRAGATTGGTSRVVVLPKPGKSAAWNAYIHELSDPQADVLFLLDADIRLTQPNTLSLMLATLRDSPEAEVVVDDPIKETPNQRGKVEAVASELARKARNRGPARISGMLYGGFAEALRRVWMPIGLPVEDGFLRAMILTRGFTEPERFERVVLAPGASHVYEAHGSVSAYLKHERRIVIGGVLNKFLFGELGELGKRGHVGELIRKRNEDDPRWFKAFTDRMLDAAGPWVVPRDEMLKRLLDLRGAPLRDKISRLPLAAAASVIQAMACIDANRMLKAGLGVGHW
jgi:glycosyltransferase involved in cell wall biosynthesis